MTGPDDGHGGRRRPVEELGAELAAMRRTLRDTDAIARECAGLLSEALPKLDELAEGLATVRGQVDELLAEGERPEIDPGLARARELVGLTNDPAGPWCWPTMDRAEAERAWEQLGRWVDAVLAGVYQVTRAALPDCWPRHPDMLAELMWLRQSYLEAYLPGRPAAGAADWHLRHLPGVLATVGRIARGGDEQGRPLCGPGHHRLPWATLGDPGDELDDDGRSYDERAAMPATREHWSPAFVGALADELEGRRDPPAR